MKFLPPLFFAVVVIALAVTPGGAQGVEGSSAKVIAPEAQISDASALDAAVRNRNTISATTLIIVLLILTLVT